MKYLVVCFFLDCLVLLWNFAALVTLKHLLQKNVKCRNMLENDAGGGSVSGIIPVSSWLFLCKEKMHIVGFLIHNRSSMLSVSK
jgi:hypothetical protein